MEAQTRRQAQVYIELIEQRAEAKVLNAPLLVAWVEAVLGWGR